MYRVSKLSLSTVFSLMAFLMFLTSGNSWAAALDPRVRDELTESTVVTPVLVEALEHQERVVARIYFLPPKPADEALSI